MDLQQLQEISDRIAKEREQEKQALIERRGRFGKALRAAREERKMSAVEVAELAKLSSSQLSNYENGKQYPAMETFWNLCRVLKLDAGKLMMDVVTNR